MGRPNPVTWVIDSLERGDLIRVVDDVFENPLYNVSAGAAIWKIVERETTGVVHLAGRDVVSRYEFARMVAARFGLDAGRIRAVPSSDFPDIAPRPPDTSFVTTRMEHELGIAPAALGRALETMAARPRATT
jgi:dTDP-4-dehydrorhamnose reductase